MCIIDDVISTSNLVHFWCSVRAAFFCRPCKTKVIIGLAEQFLSFLGPITYLPSKQLIVLRLTVIPCKSRTSLLDSKAWYWGIKICKVHFFPIFITQLLQLQFVEYFIKITIPVQNLRSTGHLAP